MGFASAATPWCMALAGTLLIAGLYGALFAAPADYQQGDSARIMYVHVPAAWLAMAGYSGIVIASAIGLIFKHPLADTAAKSMALPGAVFTALALITGSLWGKPTWGTFWVWDARLTSVLVLLFLYVGYMAIWEAIEEPTRAARAAAILALVGAVNVPIIHYSVEWWSTLHQGTSVLRKDGPSMPWSMLWPLLSMAFAYQALFAGIVLVRMRSEILERRLRTRRLSLGEEAP
ncbi:MAG TPA: heme transporter HemC [Alphaproteobacteria bacterium]|nr:heme transporter HemC [Alphaproteobacteria bacterium]HAJ48708.1 heme transporter HemC [Alphaproteobacteria bacterium]